MGTILVLIAAICIGLSHTTAKIALRGLSVNSFLIFRSCAGVVFTGLFFLTSGVKVTNITSVPLLIIFTTFAIGLLSPFLSNIFYFQGLKRGDLCILSPVHNSSPFFVCLLASLILKEKITISIAISLAIILTGVIVFSSPSRLSFVPFFYGLATAIVNAVALIIQKILLNYITPINLVLIQNIVGFGGFSIFYLVNTKFSEEKKKLMHNNKGNIFLAISSGILAYVISNLLIFFALRIIKASMVSLLQTTNIVFALFFAWAVLKEQPSRLQYIGASLIFVGGATINL